MGGGGLQMAWAAEQTIVVDGGRTMSEARQRTPATVQVDFLPDGRCTVSSAGEGFRSKVTYTPQGELKGGELRCAFPPVQTGMTVDLTVTLPPGASAPGDTRPELAWTKSGEQWTGTASVTAWPDAVTVTPLDRPWLFWMAAGMALLLVALAARRWFDARHRPAGRPSPATA